MEREEKGHFIKEEPQDGQMKAKGQRRVVRQGSPAWRLAEQGDTMDRNRRRDKAGGGEKLTVILVLVLLCAGSYISSGKVCPTESCKFRNRVEWASVCSTERPVCGGHG